MSGLNRRAIFAAQLIDKILRLGERAAVALARQLDGADLIAAIEQFDDLRFHPPFVGSGLCQIDHHFRRFSDFRET